MSFCVDVRFHLCWVCIPRSEIAGSSDNSIEPFQEQPEWFSKTLPHFSSPPQCVIDPVSPALTTVSAQTLVFLDYSHPGGCGVVSHCGFDLQFPHE